MNQKSGIMITDKQLTIFTSFAKYPFINKTRQEVKKESKEKSNNSLDLAIKKFKEENIITEKKIGKTSIYELNLNEEKVFQYISLANYKRINPLVKQATKYVSEEINKITPFFSIVIFGSYSINEETKNSDLDIAIIIDNKIKIKEIKRQIHNAKLKSIIDIDEHIITRKEFLEMLTNEDENLGKQIAKKHAAMYNQRIFYDIIKEGINNGFKI